MTIPEVDYIQLSKEEIKTKKIPTIEDCNHCKQKCCHYMAIEYDAPEDEEDFNEAKWILAHKDVVIYIDEGEWHLEFKSVCEKLGSDGHCTIYEDRPDICKDYADDMLEYGLCEGFQNVYNTYDAYFKSMEDIEAFMPKYLEELREEQRFINRIKRFFSNLFSFLKKDEENPEPEPGS